MYICICIHCSANSQQQTNKRWGKTAPTEKCTISNWIFYVTIWICCSIHIRNAYANWMIHFEKISFLFLRIAKIIANKRTNTGQFNDETTYKTCKWNRKSPENVHQMKTITSNMKYRWYKTNSSNRNKKKISNQHNRNINNWYKTTDSTCLYAMTGCQNMLTKNKIFDYDKTETLLNCQRFVPRIRNTISANQNRLIEYQLCQYSETIQSMA